MNNRKHAQLILTVDYEIFGNGLGCVGPCVIDPTKRMLQVCESYGAPLTFFVEVLEFIAMEGVNETAAQAAAVAAQLRMAVSKGHDAQLHLHPQFDGAKWDGDTWQVTDAWRCGDVSREDIQRQLRLGKSWLEKNVFETSSEDQCIAFRAGGWCVQPSDTLFEALLHEGFKIDSSVAGEYVNFVEREWADFRNIPDFSFWHSSKDVCKSADSGLLELPIASARIGRYRHYSEVKKVRASENGGLAPDCLGHYRTASDNAVNKLQGMMTKINRLGKAMLDFSTMPCDVLIEITRQWQFRFADTDIPVPLVAIAHTKNFTLESERHLSDYLTWAKGEGIRFSTYGQWLEAAGE